MNDDLKHCNKSDIVTLIQIKQTLAVLGAVVATGVVTLPFILSRFYGYVDTINIHTTEIAKLHVEVTQLHKDIYRLSMATADYSNGGDTCLNGYPHYSIMPREWLPLLARAENPKPLESD